MYPRSTRPKLAAIAAKSGRDGQDRPPTRPALSGPRIRGASPERLADSLQHPAEVALDALRAHAQDAQPERLERGLPSRVGERHVRVAMNRAVDLDHEPPRHADEVDVEGPDAVLPPEVHPEPIAPERPPQDRLAARRATPKRASAPSAKERRAFVREHALQSGRSVTAALRFTA